MNSEKPKIPKIEDVRKDIKNGVSRFSLKDDIEYRLRELDKERIKNSTRKE